MKFGMEMCPQGSSSPTSDYSAFCGALKAFSAGGGCGRGAALELWVSTGHLPVASNMGWDKNQNSSGFSRNGSSLYNEIIMVIKVNKNK